MIICNLNICWTSLLVLLTLVILFAMSSDADEKYVSVDFEVFGNVQGGYFDCFANLATLIHATPPKIDERLFMPQLKKAFMALCISLIILIC